MNAWVQMIAEDEAEGQLRAVYQELLGEGWRSTVPDFLRLHSLVPRAIIPLAQLHRAIAYGPGALSRVQRELIATVVSVINGCALCQELHSRLLLHRTRDETLVAAVMRDFRTAPLAAADRALLEYAAKLTTTPAAVEESDVERLRHLGLSDAAIVEIATQTALFNYLNRVIQGLGLGESACP
ncbi:MAG: peroxidase-related enzyme [Chloroflexota bacterium]|nr:peroxidase-related enzyme [Chloroflexota bacterium]